MAEATAWSGSKAASADVPALAVLVYESSGRIKAGGEDDR
jgi:hypothetical protein